MSSNGTAAFLPEDVSDGLPVIPPTRARVRELLDGAGVDGDESIGPVPPSDTELTYEVLAANAVMTGCSPIQFWLAGEIMRTIMQPSFGLLSVQTTTHPSGPVVLVSGPVAEAAGIAGGAGCMGPGWPSNARIGRAVRLALMNVGGARPDDLDTATMGSPVKWGLVYTDQPVTDATGATWPTYAHERTGSPEANVICAIAGEAPHNMNDPFSHSADSVLMMLGHVVACVGSNHAHNPGSSPMVVLCPEHAELVVSEGLSRAEARALIAHHARLPLGAWSPEARQGRFRERFPEIYKDADEHAEVPTVAAEDVVLAVAGAGGKHSAVIPTFGKNIGVRELPPLPANLPG